MAGLYKRNGTYYAKYYVGRKPKRVTLHTDSLQIAKAKLRQIETAIDRGDPSPLPTKTPLAQAITAYVEFIRAAKAARSAHRDAYLLRQVFGPICPALERNRVRPDARVWKRKKPRPETKAPRIAADFIEQITTADITDFIATSVRSRGLAPRSANRFREILCRLFNWSMQQGGVKMPADANPAIRTERYRQKAPQIRFLTLAQIDEQLAALADQPQLQTMVALYIYAGLRREEALWLTPEDIDLSAGANGMIRLHAKTIGTEFWQPKTKQNRAVPISTALRAYLDAYTPAASAANWYFPSPDGSRWDIDNFSHRLAAANRKAGLPWTCLDFRHTFGSQLAMKGESLYKISTLMGNSPEICRTHYAALIPEAMTDTVEFGTPVTAGSMTNAPTAAQAMQATLPRLKLVGT